MVGLQGSGKSTFVAASLTGTHAVVSKGPCTGADRREARQQRVVADLLAGGRSVVVDNTDPSVAERAPLVAAARVAGVLVRAVWGDTPVEVCLIRNDAREGRARVPLVGCSRRGGGSSRRRSPKGSTGWTWCARGSRGHRGLRRRPCEGRRYRPP